VASVAVGVAAGILIGPYTSPRKRKLGLPAPLLAPRAGTVRLSSAKSE
jgi:hypothetical protein